MNTKPSISSSTLCRMPHPNKKNKTKTQTIPSADRSTTSLSLAHQKKTKQNKKTNKQKLSTNLTLYKVYRNHCTNLRRVEIKRKKEFNL